MINPGAERQDQGSSISRFQITRGPRSQTPTTIYTHTSNPSPIVLWINPYYGIVLWKTPRIMHFILAPCPSLSARKQEQETICLQFSLLDVPKASSCPHWERGHWSKWTLTQHGCSYIALQTPHHKRDGTLAPLWVWERENR